MDTLFQAISNDYSTRPVIEQPSTDVSSVVIPKYTLYNSIPTRLHTVAPVSYSATVAEEPAVAPVYVSPPLSTPTLKYVPYPDAPTVFTSPAPYQQSQGGIVPLITHRSTTQSFYVLQGGDISANTIQANDVITSNFVAGNATISFASIPEIVDVSSITFAPDNNVLTVSADVLYLDGVPVAINVSGAEHWAVFPASTSVDLSFNSLYNVASVDFSGGDTLNVSGGEILVNGLALAPWYDVSAQGNVNLSGFNIGGVANISLATINGLSPSTAWYTVSAEGNVNLSGFDIVNVSGLGFRDGDVLTASGGLLYVNGIAVDTSGNASNWSTYPATSTVDLSTQSIVSGGGLQFGGVLNTAQFGTGPFPMLAYNVRATDVDIIGYNPVAALGITGAGGVAITSAKDIDINGDDVNIAAVGLTNILNITAAAGVAINAGAGVEIGAVGTIQILSTGNVSIGSGNVLGADTEIEKFAFNDEVMSKAGVSDLELEDIGKINGTSYIATQNWSTTHAVSTVDCGIPVPIIGTVRQSIINVSDINLVSINGVPYAPGVAWYTVSAQANVDINNFNIGGVSNISLATINGQAYSPPVAWYTVSAQSGVNMNGYGISNISTLSAQSISAGYLEVGAPLNYVDTNLMATFTISANATGQIVVQNQNTESNAATSIFVIEGSGIDYMGVQVNSATYSPFDNTLFELPTAGIVSHTSNVVIGAGSDHSSDAHLFLTYNDGKKAHCINASGALSFDASYNGGVLSLGNPGASNALLVSQGSNAPPTWTTTLSALTVSNTITLSGHALTISAGRLTDAGNRVGYISDYPNIYGTMNYGSPVSNAISNTAYTLIDPLGWTYSFDASLVGQTIVADIQLTGQGVNDEIIVYAEASNISTTSNYVGQLTSSTQPMFIPNPAAIGGVNYNTIRFMEYFDFTVGTSVGDSMELKVYAKTRSGTHTLTGNLALQVRPSQ